MSAGRITRFKNNVRIDGDLDLSNSTGKLTVSSLASAPASPTVGDAYYDTTLAKFRAYQATGWTNVDGTAAGSLDAAYNGGISITVDNGAVTLADSQTDTTGGLLINKTGAVTGANDAQVFYINSSGAHDTTGRITLLRLNMQAETATTPEGMRVTMNADADNAFIATVGSLVLTDGDLTLSSAGRSATCGVNITVANTSGDGVNVNLDALTSGDGFVINCDAGADVNYLAVQHSSANVFTASGTLLTSQLATIIDVDSAEAFLIREDGDVADVLTVDTTQDAGDTSMLLTTKVTTGRAFHVDASTITSGQGIRVTVVPGTMTAAGAAIQVYDATNAREVFAVRDDGSVYVYGTAEGTTAAQTVAGDMVITDGDLTLSGGEVSITDGVTASGQGFHLVSSVTSAIGMRVTADAVTSGDILYLDNGGATMTASGYYINCNDDNVAVFTVGYYGDVTIAGNAGSTVLTITAGDAVMSDGSVSITDADNAETVTVINNTATTVGASSSSGIVELESTSLTTGALLNLQLTEGTLNGGFYLRAWDATAAAAVFAVKEDGEVEITGAGGSDMLTISAGDVVMSDGSLTLTDADNAASVAITNNTATTSDVVTITANGLTTGSGLLVTSSGTITSSGEGLVNIVGTGVTSGDGLKIDLTEGTLNGGNYINCYDDTGAASVFSVAEDGVVTIAGTAGSNSFTLTAGDMVLSDASLSLTDADNAESVTIINNTATTIGAAATAGVVQIESTSLTTGALLNLQLTEGTLNGGFYFRAWDATAGAAVFAVKEDGEVEITGAGGSDMLTITAGDVVLADSSLTITDADNASSLVLDNDTATSADIVAIASGSLTTGSLVHLTADTAVPITTGRVLEMTADTATTATGLVELTVDALTTGIGVLVTSTSSGLTSGQLLNVDHTAAANGLGDKTGQLIDVVSSRDEQRAAGTTADDYDVLSIIRTQINTTAGGTHTSTGALIFLQNVVTQTAGTMTDTTNGIEVTMDGDGTGDAIDIVHAATAGRALDVAGAATTVPDIDIDTTGAKANNIGSVDIANNAATAAGGSILRVSSTGEPAAATSYLVDFDYSGATMTNNPDAVYIASAGTGRAVHITTTGAATATVDIESTNGGATGPVLRLSHQGGSQANDDVVTRVLMMGEDNAAADENYGQIDTVVRDVAAANPDADMIFYVDVAGTLTQRLELPYDLAGISIGSGAATAILQSQGNYDLQLQTGNATTGSIVITDGANGDITINPDGTGAVLLYDAAVQWNTRTVAAGTAADSPDNTDGVVVLSTDGAQACAVTLPEAASNLGLELTFQFDTDGGQDITLNRTGADVIDDSADLGNTSVTLADAGDFIVLRAVSDDRWIVVKNAGCTLA